eukprot:Gb_05309 [translate_table: standard]
MLDRINDELEALQAKVNLILRLCGLLPEVMSGESKNESEKQQVTIVQPQAWKEVQETNHIEESFEKGTLKKPQNKESEKAEANREDNIQLFQDKEEKTEEEELPEKPQVALISTTATMTPLECIDSLFDEFTYKHVQLPISDGVEGEESNMASFMPTTFKVKGKEAKCVSKVDENFETKGKSPKRFIKSVPKRRVDEENAKKKEVTTKVHSEWVEDKEEKMGSRETITKEAKLQEARRRLQNFSAQRFRGSPPLLVIKVILQNIPFPFENDSSGDYFGLLQTLTGSMDTDPPMKRFRIKAENLVGLWKYEEGIDAQCNTCKNHSVNLDTDCQVEKQSDTNVSQLAVAEGKYNHIYHCKNQLDKTTPIIDHVLFLTLQNM